MSVRIFKDIEEALAREVRRISYHQTRTVSDTVLQDAFDPFTGEIVQMPLEPQFYDSSADTQSIDYPNIFIKLLRTREDRFTKRAVPQYGKDILVPVATAPLAYHIVASGGDGVIAAGNDMINGLFKIKSVQVNQILRLLNGNNKGDYIIASVVPDNGGSHVITVSPDLVLNTPASVFDTVTRTVTFLSDFSLSTVKPGDDYTDSSLAVFPVVSVDTLTKKVVIGLAGNPSLAAGGKFSRPGNVFVFDPSLVRFSVLDPTKVVKLPNSDCSASSEMAGVSSSVPIDVFYLVRIDSKERQTHIEILNRIWEEFNPPRTGLPVVARSALSAETLLKADVTSGGSQTITVKSNSDFNVGDPVYIFDDISPTKSNTTEGYQRPFSSTVSAKIGTDQLQLIDLVPDTYTVNNCAKVVSNASFQLPMFHFVDHRTRDVESAQYWVHEFTFWVQTFIDRLGSTSYTGVVQSIDTGTIETDVDC